MCSVDPNGALITGVEEFADYIHTVIIEPNSCLWDSVTYFFKRTPISVPEKFTTFPAFTFSAFFAEIQKHAFAYASPDVLSRLDNIEKHLLTMP